MNDTARGRRKPARVIALALSAAVVVGLLGISVPAQAGPIKDMLRATNRSRIHHGYRPLDLNRRLSDKAMRHTYKMARQNSLFHSSNVPKLLSAYRWWIWGENVGYTSGDIADLQRAFMKSPGHRRNVLNRSFKRVGIGAKRIGGVVWVTLVFYG